MAAVTAISAEGRVRRMANWKETKCGKCKIQRGRPVCNSCFSYDKFIPIAITNADRIRSMSDEELAEFLFENTNCDCCNIQCPDKLNCPSMSSCYCRHLEWLQSEVEE